MSSAMALEREVAAVKDGSFKYHSQALSAFSNVDHLIRNIDWTLNADIHTAGTFKNTNLGK